MTRTLAGRHLTVFCLLFVLLTPRFAARADETAELIARLRETAKKWQSPVAGRSAQPFHRRERRSEV